MLHRVPHRAHDPGGADRTPGPRGPHEQRDQRPADHQPAYRRMASQQDLQQAEHHLASAAVTPGPMGRCTATRHGAVTTTPARSWLRSWTSASTTTTWWR